MTTPAETPTGADFGKLVDKALVAERVYFTYGIGEDTAAATRAALIAHNAAQQAEIERARLRAETFERQYRQVCQDHAEVMGEVNRLRNELDAERARTDRLAKGADALIHANAVLRRAVEPFAWIGQWMFARPDIPDSEPVTKVMVLNGSFDLTREHFKRCQAALAIDLDGDVAHERYRAMFQPVSPLKGIVDDARPSRDKDHWETERLARIRRDQADRVMPMIGPLLDAWDGMLNHAKDELRLDFPGIAERLDEIRAVMEGKHA